MYNRDNLFNSWPPTEKEFDALTLTQAYKVLVIYSCTFKRNGLNLMATLLIGYVVSLCKRGQLTERFLTKISVGIESELGIKIECTIEEIRNMYTVI